MLIWIAAPAGAQCRLCASPSVSEAKSAPERPLTIEVETALDLGRVAQGRGGGSVALDERSGARSVTGGLVDLGGMALKASVRITGEPGAHVRVSLPATIRLTSPDGGSADVVDLRSDLSADPVLDANGQLNFAFGGRLIVGSGASGEFRGRIAIVADYR
jgi:Domain of unknown function (DUF4402)